MQLKTVLVIDDHRLFLDGLCRLLEDEYAGIKVFTAMSAAAAIECLQQNPEIQLVLLDIALPDTDGLSLLLKMSEENIFNPVLIISANQSISLTRLALNSGAVGYIPKTFDSEEMINAINEVLKGHIYVPKRMAEQINSNHQSDIEIPVGIETKLRELGLSKHQYSVLVLAAMGYKNARIAETLQVTEHTVKKHMGILFKALRVSNRTECILNAKQRGLLPQINF